MLYRKNVGTVERWARLAAGASMAVWGLAFADNTATGWLVAASGAGLALTSLFGWCPACAMVGRKPVEGPH